MTKQDETDLKKILSKFAGIEDLLDCLKQLEEYAANTYIEENAYKHFQFDSNIYFAVKHLVDNYYKIAFSYNDNLYDISFVETVWAQPSQEFARTLVQEAKEIFERLDKELREEREQEFTSKVSKANKTKYVSKVPELKDMEGAESSEKPIRVAVEYFSYDNEEAQDKEVRNKEIHKVYKLLDKYAELTGDYSKSSYAIKKRLEDESNLNDGGNKEEDEEFVEINNNYIKPSAVVAIYEDDFGYPCVKIILKGGQEIKTKHAFDVNIFDFLEKNKESFIKIKDTHITAYIRPESVVAVYAEPNCEYNAITVVLKYGGKVIFPESQYTVDEIREQLEKGKRNGSID